MATAMSFRGLSPFAVAVAVAVAIAVPVAVPVPVAVTFAATRLPESHKHKRAQLSPAGGPF